LTACIASCGAMMTGCSGMSDAELKQALDTASRAEQALEDMKGIVSDQNAKHNADMQAYLDLLEEKNTEIAKLTEALDKSTEISDEDAYDMINLAIMKFQVMHADVHNVKMNATMGGGPYYPETMIGEVKLYMTDDNKLVYHTKSEDFSMSCYGTYNEYKRVRTAEGKVEYNSSVFHEVIDGSILSSSSFGPLLDIKSNNIVSASRNNDGIATIVSIHSSQDEKINYVITTVFDKNNKLIECIINKSVISENTSRKDYIEYFSVTFEYNKITKDEADSIIEYINNYVEE